jgi:hypothetical protein
MKLQWVHETPFEATILGERSERCPHCNRRQVHTRFRVHHRRAGTVRVSGEMLVCQACKGISVERTRLGRAADAAARFAPLAVYATAGLAAGVAALGEADLGTAAALGAMAVALVAPYLLRSEASLGSVRVARLRPVSSRGHRTI